MKIAVFSDTHGVTDPMLDAVLRSRPDMIFHLGDHDRDTSVLLSRFPEIPLYNVAGNCDYSPLAPNVLTVSLGPVRAFLTHGHLYNVKYDPMLDELRQAGLYAEADVLLFGHTHHAYRDRSLGMELLNPGTIGRVAHPRYGLLFVENGRAATEIITL